MEITGTFNTNKDGSIDLPTGDNNQSAKFVPQPVSNQDGSVDLMLDGKPVRHVLESDLLAVKGGADTKVKEWEGKETKFNTDLAESNRLREESHSQLLEAQAKNEQLVEQYKDYDALKTRAGELETENASYKEGTGKYEEEIAGRIRHSLTTVYGAKEEAIKEKDLNQLRNLEEAAKVFGNGNRPGGPANYDGGGGGPAGGTVPESESDRAGRILEEHYAKKGRLVTT